MIPAPIILYPKTNWSASGDETYYSDNTIQAISGYVPVVSGEIEYNTIIIVKQRYKVDRNGIPGTWSQESTNNVTVGTSSTSVTSIPWSFTSEDLFELNAGNVLTMEFKAYKVSNSLLTLGDVLDSSSASKIIAYIVTEKEIQASADPPTGLIMKRFNNYIKILIPQSGILINPDNDFSGCNFYMSLDAGGGDSGYVLINDIPVTDVDESETEEELLEESSYEDTTNDITITTTGTRQVINTYYSVTFDKTAIATLIQAGKIPNIFLADGETLSSDNIYYFIATVRTFDKALNQLVESPYSQELEGKFIKYTTDYQTLPKRSRSDVLFSMSKDMMTNNDKINIVPGTVIRDISDPISLEFERMYVIQDFIFACQSLDTLIKYDDTNNDGESDLVTESTNKRALAAALGVKDPINLQLLIDEQFNKYAANYDMTRKGAVKATGTVVFYTEIRPTNDIIILDDSIISTTSDIDLGVDSVNFVVKGTKIMSASNPDIYYNVSNKRYEMEADIEAETAGSSGNVPAGSITTVQNLAPTLRVVNNIPTRFGSDRESNQLLSDRVKIVRMQYDSGTEGGYYSTAMDVPGVIQARVEKADDPLMMRDYSEERKEHIGGKVDTYIRGERPIQILDQVAFSYEYPTDTLGNKIGEVFSISDASDFRLRCKNKNVDSNSPIVIVHKVRNLTKGKDYSLLNLSIIGNGDTILLEKNAANLAIGMASIDVVEVNYLYRGSNMLVLSQQPVDSISSVTTSGGVTIDTSKYQLIRSEDPLLNGNSSISKDAVKFYFNENDDIQEFIEITDEQHDMLYGTPARLSLKGVTISSIVVTPVGGGDSYLLDTDYSITEGSNTEYTYLNLLYHGMIRHGDRVSVSYQASENFNVSFITNDLVDQVQEKFNIMKHACADAIAKQAIKNYIDLSFIVTRKTGIDINILKSRIITVISNYVTGLKMGDTLTQSAVASTVRGIEGVKDITIPFTRMMKRNSSFIPLDSIGYTTFEVYNKASSSGITSYRSLDNVLTYKTSDNGGDSNLFRGIYEDNKPITLVSSPSDVSKAAGNAYIQADGKIIVSTTDGYPPQSKFYKASYYTYYTASENQVGDIYTADIEYLDIDSLSLKDIEIIDEVVNKRGL